jgi:hypothetical protein
MTEVLCQFNYTQPFFFYFFLDTGSHSYLCPVWPQAHDLPVSALRVAEITNLCPQT